MVEKEGGGTPRARGAPAASATSCSSSSRPLRLIDVSASLEDGAIVLVPDDGRCAYATLSHTWMAPLRKAVEHMAERRLRWQHQQQHGGSVTYEESVRAFTAALVQRGAAADVRAGAGGGPTTSSSGCNSNCSSASTSSTASTSLSGDSGFGSADGSACGVEAVLRVAGALRALGLARLWADFLCINQADRDELAHQLARLPGVFRGSALNVILPQGAESHGLGGGAPPPRWFERGWVLPEFLLSRANVFALFSSEPGGPRAERLPAGVAVFRPAAACSGPQRQAGERRRQQQQRQEQVQQERQHQQEQHQHQQQQQPDTCRAPASSAAVAAPPHAGGWRSGGVARFEHHLAYAALAALDIARPPCACLASPGERLLFVDASALSMYAALERERAGRLAGPAPAEFDAEVAALSRAHALLHARGGGGSGGSGGACSAGAPLSLLEAARAYGRREVLRPADRALCLVAISGGPPPPGHLGADAAAGHGGDELLAWALDAAPPEDVTAMMALDAAPAGCGDALTALPDPRGGGRVVPTAPLLGLALTGLRFAGSAVSRGAAGDVRGIAGAFQLCDAAGLQVAWESTPPGPAPGPVARGGRLLPYRTAHGAWRSFPYGTLLDAAAVPQGCLAGLVGGPLDHVGPGDARRALDATLVRLTLPSSGLDVLLVCQREAADGRLAKVGLLFAAPGGVELPWSEPAAVCIGGRPAPCSGP